MGEFSGSHVLILQDSAKLCDPLRQWLRPLGWTCDCPSSVEKLVLAGMDCPALIILDASIDAALRERFLISLRGMADTVGGTPVLLVADKDAPTQKGVSDRIDLPLDRDAAFAVIERWAGPVADHGFRNLDAPQYRLVRLAGRESADRLLRGFTQHVEAALAGLEGDEPVTRIAHQIAGLAGTLGYADLSRLWSGVERREANGPEEASAATRAVLTELKAMLGDG